MKNVYQNFYETMRTQFFKVEWKISKWKNRGEKNQDFVQFR